MHIVLFIFFYAYCPLPYQFLCPFRCISFDALCSVYFMFCIKLLLCASPSKDTVICNSSNHSISCTLAFKTKYPNLKRVLNGPRDQKTDTKTLPRWSCYCSTKYQYKSWSERSACAALGCWHKRRWPLLPSSALAELALFSLHYHPASQPANQPPGLVYFLADWYLIETKLDIYTNFGL